MQIPSLFSLTLRCIHVVSLTMLTYMATSESCTPLYARHLMEYDGRKILQSEIHTFNNLTKIDCMRACSREKYCVSFHFYPGGPTCVTLRERFNNVIVTSGAAPGYQLFQTDKPLPTIGSDCELDVDCKSLLNSRCHQGSCRCDVGHRPDGNTCRNYTALSTIGSDCELDVDCKSLLNSRCHQGSCRCDVGHRPDGNTCRNYTVACVSSPGYTWDADTDMCYRIETQVTRGWADAERACTMSQGHLIRPDTASKNNKLRELLTPLALNGLWIGARYDDCAKTWQWLDNTNVTSPLWGPKEPSGDGLCVHVVKFYQYQWNDAPCTRQEYYICEIPLN